MFSLYVQVEAAVYTDSVSAQTQFLRKQRQIAQNLTRLLIGTLIPSLLLVLLGQIVNPRGIGYLYYLQPESEENLPFKIFSVGMHLFSMSQIWLLVFPYEILLIGFSQNMKQYLELISFPRSLERRSAGNLSVKDPTTFYSIFLADLGINAKDTGIDKEEMRFGFSLETYERINVLIRKHNNVFSSLLFICKAAYLLDLVCLLYIPLARIQSKFLITPLKLLTIAAMIFYRLYVVLTSLASVHIESKVFIESWTRALPDLSRSKLPLTRLNLERLQFMTPISFRSGIFYKVKPSTLLTFLSITTTYLIVLLQI
jgi:hypothetical protein